MSGPVVGYRHPDRWPYRMSPSGGVVHAIRRVWFGQRQELSAACGEHRTSMDGAFWMYWRRRPNQARVTCKACKKRMAQPLTRAEVLAIEMERTP